MTNEQLDFRPFRASALYQKQRMLTKNFITDEHGWIRAERFSEPGVEEERAKSVVAMSDVSHLFKVGVKGTDALSYLSHNSFDGKELKPGAAYEYKIAGSQLGLCCILTPDEALIISDSEGILDLNKQSEKSCIHVTDLTSYFAGILFLGPQSRSLLSKLTELDIREKKFGNLSVQFAESFHVQCIVVRLDINEILGFALFFDRAFGEYLWDRIMYAGKEFNLSLIGLTALKNLGWRGG